MTDTTKWLLLGGLLLAATVLTGGLDLAAVGLAVGLWGFITRSK